MTGKAFRSVFCVAVVLLASDVRLHADDTQEIPPLRGATVVDDLWDAETVDPEIMRRIAPHGLAVEEDERGKKYFMATHVLGNQRGMFIPLRRDPLPQEGYAFRIQLRPCNEFNDADLISEIFTIALVTPGQEPNFNWLDTKFYFGGETIRLQVTKRGGFVFGTSRAARMSLRDANWNVNGANDVVFVYGNRVIDAWVNGKLAARVSVEAGFKTRLVALRTPSRNWGVTKSVFYRLK